MAAFLIASDRAGLPRLAVVERKELKVFLPIHCNDIAITMKNREKQKRF